MSSQIKTSYILEMYHPDDLRPKIADFPQLRVERVEIKCPEFNKFLHTTVGYDYRWGGRADWGRDEWEAYVNRDGLETWVASWSGTPAGYFELEKRPEGDVHIHTFGLLPQFIGKGLGGHLLTCAIKRAWELAETRVWLSTCSHDHPHALKNYLARGFQIQQIREGPPNPPIQSFWDMVEGSRSPL